MIIEEIKELINPNSAIINANVAIIKLIYKL